MKAREGSLSREADGERPVVATVGVHDQIVDRVESVEERQVGLSPLDEVEGPIAGTDQRLDIVDEAATAEVMCELVALLARYSERRDGLPIKRNERFKLDLDGQMTTGGSFDRERLG